MGDFGDGGVACMPMPSNRQPHTMRGGTSSSLRSVIRRNQLGLVNTVDALSCRTVADGRALAAALPKALSWRWLFATCTRSCNEVPHLGKVFIQAQELPRLARGLGRIVCWGKKRRKIQPTGNN